MPDNLTDLPGHASDGHHTFDELYLHRAVLFSVILAAYPERGWKSWEHDDGTMHDGMFIVGIKTPQGQATYHYKADMWDLFDVKEVEKAPEFDGHTPDDVLDRLLSLK